TSTPSLLTMGFMFREDQTMLFVRHTQGPFGGRWTLPLIGVASTETAEDAAARMMRDLLHVEPGPVDFLETIYLTGKGDERFVANGFICDWEGEPSTTPEIFEDAIWAPPSVADQLGVVPEIVAWLERLLDEGNGDT